MNNITFFVPAYNCENTIAETVDSIFNDNFNEGDELIIVNDGSTDNTSLIIEEILRKYPQTLIFKHLKNKGGATARNTAVENAKNELLFCLDSDNVLQRGSIAPLKSYLIQHNADVAAFQHLHYFSKDTDIIDMTWSLKPGIFTKEDCLSKIFSPGASGNYLFTKQSWLNAKGYPEFAGSLDTWGFGLRQLMTGAKIMIMADSHYYHRLLPDSYYLRDAWSRRKSVSLRGLQLIIPFLDQIDDRDIDYIFSKKGRFLWMEELEQRPIRFVNSKRDTVWEEHKVKPSHSNYINRIINLVKKRFY